MKNKIVGFALALMFVPMIASAQAMPSNNDALISALNQLIVLINQEIQSLEAQLAVMQANEASTTPITAIPQLATSTVIIQDIPVPVFVPPAPTTGNIPWTPPAAPTCTLTNDDLGNGYVTEFYLTTNPVSTKQNPLTSTWSAFSGVYMNAYPKVKAENMIGKNYQGGEAQINPSGSNFYQVTVKDQYGQMGTCDDTIIPVAQVCSITPVMIPGVANAGDTICN